MTQHTTPADESKSPLAAAQKIVAELQGMSPENQSLAVQFAMQTLRLAPPTAHAAATPPRDHQYDPRAHAAAGSLGQSTDIKSFTSAKSPQSDQQFTAVVAFYNQFEANPSERKNVIDAATMKEAARLAGWPQVERWTMTLTNAKNAGYLNTAGRGKYTLSSVGENLVAITLPGKGNGASTGITPAKKKAKTTKSGRKSR